MEALKLSFCKITKLSNKIAEVVVNDGIEVNGDMLDEMEAWMTDNMPSDCGFLVNKKNSYTYTFEAQMRLGTISQIKARAVLIYNKVTEISTISLTRLPQNKTMNLKIFEDRDEAIEWLETQV